jgi:hypothetical protein
MKCGFEVTCHLMNWFWSLPWWVHWGLLICLVLALWGVLARLWNVAKAFGGWQAGVAAVGAGALLLAALWPRKGKDKPVETDEIFPHPDKPKKDPWLRQPGETVADWWERTKDH